MPFTHRFKPSHKEIRRYYEELSGYDAHEVAHEGATSTAFQNLLAVTCKKADWHLVPQLPTKIRGKQVRPDGTLRDDFNLHRGYWEAKDSSDKLDVEIKKKIALGYPLTNTIFEDTSAAVLYQNGQQVEPRYDLRDPQQLCDLLNQFYSHTEPDIEGFEQAVDEFKERVPDLALALKAKIDDAHRTNRRFQEAFQKFFDLCRQSLNPNLSEAAVDEMLIQHLLTIRLFDTIFDNPDFVRRNVIAAEVEKVIDALASKAFSREQFLRSLDRFYVAIESAARVLGEDFAEKQHFLNTVYERFFQGYSVKVADTHGIVYTPQEIVDFMCASVEEVLKTEFGKTLGSKDVNILDPCTGTGNFIANLIRRVPKRDLPRVYREQLFANEVMLLPYYIAALNIEHAYFERFGEYEAFEGLCFVDTLDLADERYGKDVQRHLHVISEENTQRVERQTRTPITVIIGNPPYNANQLNENDNNKNRKYPHIDGAIRRTYVKDSSATLANKNYDMYWRFLRWSTDRLGDRPGIVCLITNNGFIHGKAADGLRFHLQRCFERVYHFDMKGNARTTGEQRRKEGGNVFDDKIRAGVGISILVRIPNDQSSIIKYHAVGDYWPSHKKKAYVSGFDSVKVVPWVTLKPDPDSNWLVAKHATGFKRLLPLSTKKVKAGKDDAAVFHKYSLGVSTNRDEWAYEFLADNLCAKMQRFVRNYNSEVFRYAAEKVPPKDVDQFVNNNPTFLKWTDRLKDALRRGIILEFSAAKIRDATWRPFTKKRLYFDSLINHRQYLQSRFFPNEDSELENKCICCTNHTQVPFVVQITNNIPDQAVGSRGGQTLPFYVYSKDEKNRRENITDWALAHFREHYHDKKITKWDIFYYVYGLLHHPGYRTKFAENLKRELPRIPLAPDFKAFARAGKKLADLHLNYEQLDPWPLKWIETEGVPLSYHVEKMRLSKDKTQLVVNDSLTLAGIPPEVFDYRLGNRSALDWVIDQYQISTDARSGITSDPNNPDDEQYIVRLVGQVTRVSVETVKIVNSLPAQYSK
jgi:predicted helicase